MAKILVVEDELSLQKLIEYDLKNAGHECITCGDADRALELASSNDFDVILLDYLLPKMTGVEICTKIRTTNKDVYIMMLTAVGEEINKLNAFECGADDYIVKPFSMREVLARIDRALTRSNKAFKSLVFKHIQIDENIRTVFCNSEEVVLTKTEYEMLKYLVARVDKVVTRDEILENVWGYDYVGESRTVDVYAHKLREKLELDLYLKTVRGVGYILRS